MFSLVLPADALTILTRPEFCIRPQKGQCRERESHMVGFFFLCHTRILYHMILCQNNFLLRRYFHDLGFKCIDLVIAILQRSEFRCERAVAFTLSPSQLIAHLILSLRLSPDTFWRKFISAACHIHNLILWTLLSLWPKFKTEK